MDIDERKKFLLEGNRIYLREVRLSDVNANYHVWMNDPEVMQYMESRFTAHSIESIQSFVEMMLNDKDYLFLAIVVKERDRHIGNIKLGPINRTHSFADIGILIGEKDCWGKGYGTEAIRLLTSYAFTTLKLHKLTAGCYDVNKGSENAFKKVGFVVEGVRKQHRLYDGKYVDSILFGLINDTEIAG